MAIEAGKVASLLPHVKTKWFKVTYLHIHMFGGAYEVVVGFVRIACSHAWLWLFTYKSFYSSIALVLCFFCLYIWYVSKPLSFCHSWRIISFCLWLLKLYILPPSLLIMIYSSFRHSNSSWAHSLQGSPCAHKSENYFLYPNSFIFFSFCHLLFS